MGKERVFKLTELLVVIFIILLLIAILMPPAVAERYVRSNEVCLHGAGGVEYYPEMTGYKS